VGEGWGEGTILLTAPRPPRPHPIPLQQSWRGVLCSPSPQSGEGIGMRREREG